MTPTTRGLPESGVVLMLRASKLLRHASLAGDQIGRRAFKGQQAIRDQYARTNITYPGHGRPTREMYTNVLIDIDLDAGTARSTTAYTVAQQAPDGESPFALLVAGRYEDEWSKIDDEWHWTDRYIVVQFKNDLERPHDAGLAPLQLRASRPACGRTVGDGAGAETGGPGAVPRFRARMVGSGEPATGAPAPVRGGVSVPNGGPASPTSRTAAQGARRSARIRGCAPPRARSRPSRGGS